MADIDDQVLAYAMAVGNSYMLFEPLPGKAKKVQHRKLWLNVQALEAGGYKHRPEPVAHFIARLMSDRRVSVKKDPDSKERFHWVVADGRTGLELRFEGQSEKSVRALMAGASALKVNTELGLGVLGEATEKLRQFRRLEAIAITKERAAEKKWPPPEGSQTARILALARASTDIAYTRANQSYGWSDYNSTSVVAFISKLKSPALAVARFDVHEHDSPAAMEHDLPPGYVFVEVAFCAIDDTRGKEITKYEFLVKPPEAAEPKKQSPRKSKADN